MEGVAEAGVSSVVRKMWTSSSCVCKELRASLVIQRWIAVRCILAMATAMSLLSVQGQSTLSPTVTGTTRRKTPINETSLERLKTDLLANYDRFAMPNLGSPTNLTIAVNMKHVSLSEMQSIVTVNAWVKMEWTDSRLSWQGREAEYGGLKSAYFMRTEIWQPSIMLKNSFAGKTETPYDSAMLVVHSDGTVMWVPAAVFEAICDLDLRNWPFEEHNCDLILGSWIYSSEQLRIINASYIRELQGQSGEFYLQGVTVTTMYSEQEESTEPFSDVLYKLTLRRRAGTYKAVIFAPASVVIILCLATFLLPPRSGEKIVLGGVCAMLVCIFLIYFAHSLPVLTNQTPLIVVFYSASLYLVCFSLVVAVLVLNISRRNHSTGLPWAIKRILTGSCGRFLLLSSYMDQMMGVTHGRCSELEEECERPVVMEDQLSCSTSVAGTSKESGNVQAEWLLLAVAVDRVVLIIYSLIFIIIAAVFHV